MSSLLKTQQALEVLKKFIRTYGTAYDVFLHCCYWTEKKSSVVFYFFCNFCQMSWWMVGKDCGKSKESFSVCELVSHSDRLDSISFKLNNTNVFTTAAILWLYQFGHPIFSFCTPQNAPVLVQNLSVALSTKGLPIPFLPEDWQRTSFAFGMESINEPLVWAITKVCLCWLICCNCTGII